MPYDQTPQNSTYQTKNIKLIQEWDARKVQYPKDNETSNCFYELISNKQTGDKDYNVISRAGTSAYAYSSASSNIRGMYYWEDYDRLYIASDTIITVIVGTTGAVITIINTPFTSGSWDIGFTEFSLASGTPMLMASDGSHLISIDIANSMTTCTDPNLPIPHDPHILYLDGYLFLAKRGTADIYNSNLDDPMTWTPGDFISAEMLPDKLIRIDRLANYLVAFGTAAIEYFWDVGNPSSSPLQRNDTPVKLVGYLGGLSHWKNKIYFIGNTETTGPELYVLEDLKIESISIPPIRRGIVQALGYLGSIASFSGHDFYILTSGSRTYMMDLETKLWTRLRYKQQTDFPIQYSVSVPVVGYGHASLFTLNAGSLVGVFRNDVYLDNGIDFSPTIITDREMFDSYRMKFGGRISILADRPENDASIALSWSDDDYQTYTNPRIIPLNVPFPVTHQLGSFRRRAHKLVHTGDAQLRIKSLEIDINVGNR